MCMEDILWYFSLTLMFSPFLSLSNQWKTYPQVKIKYKCAVSFKKLWCNKKKSQFLNHKVLITLCIVYSLLNEIGSVKNYFHTSLMESLWAYSGSNWRWYECRNVKNVWRAWKTSYPPSNQRFALPLYWSIYNKVNTFLYVAISNDQFTIINLIWPTCSIWIRWWFTSTWITFFS